jgi:hypothetical protein
MDKYHYGPKQVVCVFTYGHIDGGLEHRGAYAPLDFKILARFISLAQLRFISMHHSPLKQESLNKVTD